MTTHRAGENHPDTIVISDENEAPFPRDEPDNSRLEGHPHTESSYMEVAGVLVESSANTRETTNPRKRNRTRSSEVSELVGPEPITKYPPFVAN